VTSPTRRKTKPSTIRGACEPQPLLSVRYAALLPLNPLRISPQDAQFSLFHRFSNSKSPGCHHMKSLGRAFCEKTIQAAPRNRAGPDPLQPLPEEKDRSDLREALHRTLAGRQAPAKEAMASTNSVAEEISLVCSKFSLAATLVVLVTFAANRQLRQKRGMVFVGLATVADLAFSLNMLIIQNPKPMTVKCNLSGYFQVRA
jgi:hypothetical protein